MWTAHGCRRSTRSPCPYGDDDAHAERRLRATLRTPSGPGGDGTTPGRRHSSMATHWLAEAQDSERSREPRAEPLRRPELVSTEGASGAASGPTPWRPAGHVRSAGSRAVTSPTLPAVAVRMYRVASRTQRGSTRPHACRHVRRGTSTLDRGAPDAAARVAGVPGHLVRPVGRVTLRDVCVVVAKGVHHGRGAVVVGEVSEGHGIGDGRE